MQENPESIKWFYEESYSGYYIAFDGGSGTKDAVSSELERKGVSIWKVGPSFRKAADGRQYEWYIKLSRATPRAVIQEIMAKASKSPLRELEIIRNSLEGITKEKQVASASDVPSGWGQEEVPIKLPSDYGTELVPPPEGHKYPWEEAEPTIPVSDDFGDKLFSLISRLWTIAEEYGAPQDDPIGRISWINAQLPALHDEIEILKRQATETKAENTLSKRQSDSLKREVDGLKYSLETRERENSLFKIQVEQLEKDKASQGESIDALARSRQEKIIEGLKGELSKSQADFNMIRELAEVTENKNADRINALTGEIQKLSQENVGLKNRIRDSAMPALIVAKPNPGSRNRAIEIIQRALETFMPRFIFHDSTYETIVDQFSDFSKLFNALYALHGKQQKTGKISIKGADGWFEMDDHISTGRDHMGRIYYRRQGSKDSYDIYIHRKKDNVEQEKLFEKLAGMAPFRNE